MKDEDGNDIIFMSMVHDAKNYTVLLTKDKDGGCTGEVPSCPGCITFSENVNSIMDMVHSALTDWLRTQKEMQQERMENAGNPSFGERWAKEIQRRKNVLKLR